MLLITQMKESLKKVGVSRKKMKFVLSYVTQFLLILALFFLYQVVFQYGFLKFQFKCKQEGIIYIHHRVKKKTNQNPNSSSSCLSNILKKQNRAQAQFFFAFQVSFKSRDSHDPAILEVEASKCFTSCKHSSMFLQVTYYLRRLWLKRNLSLSPFPKLLCVILCEEEFI